MFAISSPGEFLVVPDVRSAHFLLGRYIFVCDLLYSIGAIFLIFVVVDHKCNMLCTCVKRRIVRW